MSKPQLQMGKQHILALQGLAIMLYTLILMYTISKKSKNLNHALNADVQCVGEFELNSILIYYSNFYKACMTDRNVPGICCDVVSIK